MERDRKLRISCTKDVCFHLYFAQIKDLNLHVCQSISEEMYLSEDSRVK